ncbi:MAG: Mur ligase domain-containing protein, partial [Longimicrobiaceae bacterium]
MPAELPDDFAGVSTDTRALTPGSLFVALAGERFDAHDYLDAAAAAGAAAAVV